MSQPPKRRRRRGRALELLVQRIKVHQLPDARVLSPEFVPDVDTGQRREVDIGVRQPTSDGERFIAIECRDRGAMQAVEWIEQLISKKNSIAADVLVAVTSSSFSRPARMKALKHGVILTRLTSRLPAAVADLAASFLVTIQYLAPRIERIELKLHPDLTDDLEAYSYVPSGASRPMSLGELADYWTTPDLIRSIPQKVTDWSKAKYAKVELKHFEGLVFAHGRPYPILGAKISYQLNYAERTLPLRAVKELAGLDGPSGMEAEVFNYGDETTGGAEIVVDQETGEVRLDILAAGLLSQGQVLIGGRLRAAKPTAITTMRLDL